MHLLPCTPCFTWQWVSPCVAMFTTCTLKHANSNTSQGSAERLCLLPDAAEEFYCCQLSLPIPAMWEKCQKIPTDKKVSQTSTHTNTLILKEEGSENAKKIPKRHLASSGKEKLEWKRECSPEARWIDEWREGEWGKASRRQRRPCLVVGWVREGGSFGLLRDRQASFS